MSCKEHSEVGLFNLMVSYTYSSINSPEMHSALSFLVSFRLLNRFFKLGIFWSSPRKGEFWLVSSLAWVKSQAHESFSEIFSRYDLRAFKSSFWSKFQKLFFSFRPFFMPGVMHLSHRNYREGIGRPEVFEVIYTCRHAKVHTSHFRGMESKSFPIEAEKTMTSSFWSNLKLFA